MDEKDLAQENLEKFKKSFKIGIYQHYKGHYYTVYSLSIKEDTCEILVHYFSHNKKTRWTRTAENFTSKSGSAPYEFLDGRFKFIREASFSQLLEAAGLDAARLELNT